MLCVLVFSVDYNDELDILVSGSADFTVKVWALSAGTCLNTLTGHTEWVTKVRRLLMWASLLPRVGKLGAGWRMVRRLTDVGIILAEGGEAGRGLEDGRQ